MTEIYSTRDIICVSPEDVLAGVSSLVYWLETLPEDAILCHTGTGVPIIKNPRMTAKFVRLLCPAEGMA